MAKRSNQTQIGTSDRFPELDEKVLESVCGGSMSMQEVMYWVNPNEPLDVDFAERFAQRIVSQPGLISDPRTHSASPSLETAGVTL